jgi:aspartate racemase
VIGVVGGVGPFAGLDLLSKILDQTLAGRDQDHLPVLSISRPGPIPDRTEFLLGRATVNPGYPILEQAALLGRMGATVVGVPCNTAHAPVIFSIIETGLARIEQPPRLLHMIRETVDHLRRHYASVGSVGVLSTTGTYRTRLYPEALEPLGFRVVVPEATMQEAIIHPAVYDPVYGLKACGRATPRARDNLLRGLEHLRAAGAEAVILGCTEMPLALPGREEEGLALVDPALILARALIREVAPERLRPWEAR